MAEVINLNKFRKAREAEKSQRNAKTQRAKHGRDAGERVRQRDEQARGDKEHEAKQLDEAATGEQTPD